MEDEKPGEGHTTQQIVEKSAQAARQAKQQTTQLLDVAKRAVEMAIEQDEAAAMSYIGSNSAIKEGEVA